MLDTIKQAKIGSIVSLYEEIDEEIDAFEYFAKLSNYGKKKNSLLLEDKNKSIGTSNPCLLVTGKDNEFEIKALNETGKKILQFVKKDFGFCDKAIYGRDKIHGTLTPTRRTVSEDQRLKLKTHMDIIRAIAFRFKAGEELVVPCGMLGMISYDFVDNVGDLPANKEDMINDPDYALYFLDNMFVVDHDTKKTYFVSNAIVTDNKRDDLYKSCNRIIKGYEKLLDKKLPKLKKSKKKVFEVDYDTGMEEFLDMVKKLKRHILEGEILSANPSRMAISNYGAEPLDIYSKFKNGLVSFFMNDGEGISMGHAYDSLKVKDNVVELRVGTNLRPRDNEDNDLDNKYEIGLITGENEIVKHTMQVDAARNEISKISEPGTRYASKLFAIEKQENTQKVASNVVGKLKEGLDGLHVFLSSINFGAGLPKLKSMELLRKMEKTKRCFNSGSIVMIGADKKVDSKTLSMIRIKKDKAYSRVSSYVFHGCDEEKVVEKNESKLSAFLENIKGAGGFK